MVLHGDRHGDDDVLLAASPLFLVLRCGDERYPATAKLGEKKHELDSDQLRHSLCVILIRWPLRIEDLRTDIVDWSNILCTIGALVC